MSHRTWSAFCLQKQRGNESREKREVLSPVSHVQTMTLFHDGILCLLVEGGFTTEFCWLSGDQFKTFNRTARQIF